MGQIELESTIMAVREELMRFFKGTCVDRVTTSRNVRTIYLDEGRAPYQYLRQQQNEQQKSGIYIEDTLLFRVQHLPEVIKFEKNLDRSPQLRDIKKAVEKFMDKYLSGVEKKYATGKAPEERDDSTLLKTKPRVGDRERDLAQENMNDMYRRYVEAMPNINWAPNPYQSYGVDIVMTENGETVSIPQINTIRPRPGRGLTNDDMPF